MDNPLVPAAVDAVWAVLAVVAFALAVAALVSVARSARELTSRQALAWTLLVVLVPALGAAGWFAIGRRAALRSGPSS